MSKSSELDIACGQFAFIAFIFILIVLSGRKRTRTDGYTQGQTETQRRAEEGRALRQAADNIKRNGR